MVSLKKLCRLVFYLKLCFFLQRHISAYYRGAAIVHIRVWFSIVARGKRSVVVVTHCQLKFRLANETACLSNTTQKIEKWQCIACDLQKSRTAGRTVNLT